MDNGSINNRNRYSYRLLHLARNYYPKFNHFPDGLLMIPINDDAINIGIMMTVILAFSTPE